MPRKVHIDMSGPLHHLFIQGIERKRIFWDHQDRNNFLDRLARILLEAKTACYAWAFLPVHLLLGTGEVLLAIGGSVFCYWAVKELALRETEVARRLKLTQPTVCISVRRGEHIAKQRGLPIPGS